MTDQIELATPHARRPPFDFGNDETCDTCGSYNQYCECEAVPGCGEGEVKLWTPAMAYPALGDFDPDE